MPRIRPVAALVVIPALALAAAASGDIIFVNATQLLPAIFQNGQSWATAYKSLQDGLADAGLGDELWVAAGTYTPTTGTDRNATFEIPQGVTVLGGFPAGAPTIFDQDPATHLTILSGAIGAAGTADNSLNVITCDVDLGSSFLDGVTVTGGNADNGFGGGLTMVGDGTLIVTRCRFVGNLAASGAGANCAGSTRLSDCLFESNTSTGGGAAIRATDTVKIANCAFVGNASTLPGSAGGAIFLLNTGLSKIYNCVFNGNSAFSTGGAIRSNNSDLTISNCTFVANEAASGGALAAGVGADLDVFNSIFFENSGGASIDIALAGGTVDVQFCAIGGAFAAGIGCFSGDPRFVDADGVDGIVGTADDDLSLRTGSPCVDAGSFDLINSDETDLDADGLTTEVVPVDLAGGPRLVNDVRKNVGTGVIPHSDLGAFELERDTIVWCVDATAPAGGFGASWDDPFNTIHEAFERVLDIKFGEPAEIWVTGGTYAPTATTDRTKSFDIPDGARLFGGFIGVEGGRDERDWIANASILTGAIGGASTSDNSFHVVTTDGASNFIETALDGFVVTAGNANGSGDNAFGGGIFARNSGSLRVRNCRLIANLATNGGALASKGGGSVLIANCLISGNSAVKGGGVFAEDCSVSLFHNTIVHNVASANGGGVFSNKGSFFTSIAVGSSILVSNESPAAGQLAQMDVGNGASLSCNYSCIECFSGLFDNGFNFATSPRFVDLLGADGTPGTLDDNPAIGANSSCIDAGNPSAAALVPDFDDLDDDGVTNEVVPLDILLGERNLNDTGIPGAGVMQIDTGCAEFQGTSGPTPNPGDLDGDGFVNGADLGILLSNFGSSGPVGDLNNDCLVDGADLGELLANWT